MEKNEVVNPSTKRGNTKAPTYFTHATYGTADWKCHTTLRFGVAVLDGRVSHMPLQSWCQTERSPGVFGRQNAIQGRTDIK